MRHLGSASEPSRMDLSQRSILASKRRSRTMSKHAADVSPSGAIVLGPNVVCDGFVQSAPIRIQTHIHDDHMDGFASSKGFQTILMSEATRELLIAEFDAELAVRSNLRAVPVREALN